MEINCKLVVTALKKAFAFCAFCTILLAVLPRVESLLSVSESR